MFDIGWTEMVVIGVVALVVIGPKDLPDMFRTMGRFTGKMRAMARDFQRAMDQAAKDTGVSDIAADLKTATSAKSMGLNAVKDAATKFEKWDPLKNAAKPAAAVVKPAVAVTEPSIMGPATQALADQQAARKAIAKDAAEKLKAASASPAITDPVVAAPPVKPARKPRAKPAAPPPVQIAVELAKAPAKPRAPRKTAKAGDA